MTQKWYLMPPCLTRQYKVGIKGKVELKGKEERLSLPLGVVAIGKEAFGSLSTTVANSKLLLLNRNHHNQLTLTARFSLSFSLSLAINP